MANRQTELYETTHELADKVIELRKSLTGAKLTKKQTIHEALCTEFEKLKRQQKRKQNEKV